MRTTDGVTSFTTCWATSGHLSDWSPWRQTTLSSLRRVRPTTTTEPAPAIATRIGEIVTGATARNQRCGSDERERDGKPMCHFRTSSDESQRSFSPPLVSLV